MQVFMNQPVASRITELAHAMRHVMTYIDESAYIVKSTDPCVSNFALGNPQDIPLTGVVDALKHAVEPRNKDWFAYKLSEPESQEVVAASLREELGIPFEPDDIAMTNGAFGALAVAIQVVVDPGDEVIFNLPPWFFYVNMVVSAGGVPVKVPVDRNTFDLDLNAIERAITPRTRAIIVNTPNNPTGKIYPPETLERLAAMLTGASHRHGRPIYLISDEPYRRIVFEGNTFHSPLAFYPYAMMTYSYGKVLLTPGERIGYLALPPSMPDRKQLRAAIRTVQFTGGFLFPNATLQHAIADLDTMSIDIERLQRKRDRMVEALREIGYEVHVPQGTFYLLPKSPWDDDWAFMRLLEKHDILCLPGTVLEFPGFFRISLTASEEMIEWSLPGFESAFQYARMQPSPAGTDGI
ncbi:pyridoxal phosphate-dependent aminotransferase [soil metagenome]